MYFHAVANSVFFLIGSSLRAREAEKKNHRCSWTRAVKHARTPLCFPLAWDKNCNNFFERRSPLSISPKHDCYLRSALLVAIRRRERLQLARKRRLLLFTYSAPAAWIFDSSLKTNGEVGGKKNKKNPRSSFVTLAARVRLRSFITSSKAAVSSACFWLCKAIFSLNFRGLFEVAMFRSSAPFSFNGQCQVTLNEDTQLPTRALGTKHYKISALWIVLTSLKKRIFLIARGQKFSRNHRIDVAEVAMANRLASI